MAICVNDFFRKKLKRRYGDKLQKYIDFAMNKVFKNKEKISYDFFSESLVILTDIDKNNEIADDKKTYVINRKMYISDWAMKQNKDVLMHIVIHEIIHILNPEYTEEKVIEETDKKFSKLRNLSEWKVFL